MVEGLIAHSGVLSSHIKDKRDLASLCKFSLFLSVLMPRISANFTAVIAYRYSSDSAPSHIKTAGWLRHAALGSGLDFIETLRVLSSFKAVPGRLERVNNSQGKNIFVDYAHTEDALQNVLETLKEVTKGKLLCVFGCGGNRDRLKRPKMGKVAKNYADEVFITSDNPRGEVPAINLESNIYMSPQEYAARAQLSNLFRLARGGLITLKTLR